MVVMASSRKEHNIYYTHARHEPITRSIITNSSRLMECLYYAYAVNGMPILGVCAEVAPQCVRMATTGSQRPHRCCRCNGTVGTCQRCACAKRGSPCSSCLPGDRGMCHNQPQRTQHQPRGPPSPSPSSPQPSSCPHGSSSPPQPVSPPPASSYPSISFILQADVPTLQHVPKGARDRWARVLSECLSGVCVAPADISGWTKLFMLPKCLLASPATGHRLRWREILRLVKSRLDRWIAGDVCALWAEAVSGGQSLSKRAGSYSSTSQRSRNIWRAKKAVQDGQYSKAIKALTSNGLATPSREVLQEMLSKHPQSAPPTLPPGPAPTPVSLLTSAVRKGVLSFPHGSAPGPSALRPSHLREAVRCPSPDQADRLLAALTNVVNLLAAGQAPPTINPFLCGASLLASRKKSGGHRPIAVGEVLRRLVSKCLASHVRQSAISILNPLQLGVAVQGGCEAIVHAVSQAMTSLPDERRWSILLDFSNAFNNINREAMFVEFRRRLPGLSAWMEFCYSGQPLLHLGKDTIHSCCGVQQGDPLGPLGFALTLHPLVERIKAEVPSLALNAWYLDDGTLVGPTEDLSAALEIVEREGPSLGLYLNRGKSLLYIPNQCDAAKSTLPPDVPVTRGGFCLLGCPIGPPSFCEEVLQARVAKIRECLDVLRDLGDSQLETTLLRSCLALPKLSYALRTCPPSHVSQAASDFDVAIRETLEAIVGGPISDWSWRKASLPSSLGGVNLRSASLHAPAAFVASSAQSQDLVESMLGLPSCHPPHLDVALSALSSAASQPHWQSTADIDVSLRQHSLSHAIDESVHEKLLATAPSTRARALALSTTLPHAGDWLNGVPSAALGLHLQDQEFRCCLRYWLGVPLHSAPYSCPECSGTADEYGAL